MKKLCPICFASSNQRGHICFDGNFQLRTLGTLREKRTESSALDSRDNRIFVTADSTESSSILHEVSILIILK
jgi:hypothetical protein